MAEEKQSKKRSQNAKSAARKKKSTTKQNPASEQKKETARQIAQSLETDSKKNETETQEDKPTETKRHSSQRLKCLICLLMVAIPALLIVFGIVKLPYKERVDQDIGYLPAPIEETPLIEESDITPEEQDFADAAIEEYTQTQSSPSPPDIDDTELYPDIPLQENSEPVMDQEREAMRNRIRELESMVETQMQRIEEALVREERREREMQRERNIDPLIIAILQLRDRLEKGLPYQADIELIERLGQFDQVISRTTRNLATSLDREIVSYTELRRQFDGLIYKAIQAEREANASHWWDRFVSWIYGIFNIRQVGEDITGPSTEATLSRAEKLLHHGQLERTLNELEQLEGAAARVMEDWIVQARTHQRIDTLLSSLLQRTTTLAVNETDNSDYKALLESVKETIQSESLPPLSPRQEGELPQRLPKQPPAEGANP